jgi:hypothetical protein
MLSLLQIDQAQLDNFTCWAKTHDLATIQDTFAQIRDEMPQQLVRAACCVPRSKRDIKLL